VSVVFEMSDPVSNERFTQKPPSYRSDTSVNPFQVASTSRKSVVNRFVHRHIASLKKENSERETHPY